MKKIKLFGIGIILIILLMGYFWDWRLERAKDNLEDFLIKGNFTDKVDFLTWKKEHGVYEFVMEINGKKIETHISKDGKIAFLRTLDLNIGDIAETEICFFS